MDDREGTLCEYCCANLRVIELTKVFLQDVSKRVSGSWRTIPQLARDSAGRALRIAEINELPGLHNHLIRVAGVISSEYGGEDSQDLMALSYADDQFDYVLTSDTLEHVPDFDRALSEIRRILKLGGKHIFTIPVMWQRSTRKRASVANGEIVHHLPPSYHGAPTTDASDWLVFNEFGGDVTQRIENAGFTVGLHGHAGNPLVITFVTEKI